MRTFIVSMLAVALLAPVATATWFVQGSWEPDTGWDSPLYNPTEPNVADDLRVYFNVFPQQFHTGTNMNNEIIGSRQLTPGVVQQIAVLGAWQDCDRDGYVGSGTGAVSAYRVELLQVMTAADGIPRSCGSSHVVDGWVYEMLTIGPAIGQTAGGLDTEVAPGTFLSGAYIWGDFNLPGEGPRLSCTLTPMPHGTTASTGGLLRYVDCIDGYLITRTINANDQGLGLAFEREDLGCSKSALNVVFPVTLFGRNCDPHGRGEAGLLQLDTEKDNTDGSVDDPNAEDHAVTVLDCDGNPAVEVHNPTGSYVDSANRTFDAVADDCSADDPDSNEFSRRYPVVLDGYSESATFVRTKTDYRFFFNDGQCAGHVAVPEVIDVDLSGPVKDSVGCVPDTAGVGALGGIGGAVEQDVFAVPMANQYGYGWRSYNVFVTLPQVFDRTRGDLHARQVYTWYADIGDEALAAGFDVPGSYIYGSEACQGATSGIRNSWDCNKSNWWSGQNPNERLPFGVSLGQRYQLRDIDCYDGEAVAGSNVFLSSVPFTNEGPCEDA